MASNKVSFFEKLARKCAERPWYVVITWVVLFAIAVMLFETVLTKNMTTAIEFTTNTESKRADDVFKERFIQAAYQQENTVITSNTYTADDPEFWAYVDGLYAKLKPLMDEGIVKSVQYADPGLREGLPLVSPALTQMSDSLGLFAGSNPPTPEELKTSADGLRATAANMRQTAGKMNADSLTASGKQAYDGLLQTASGLEEVAATLDLSNGLQNLGGTMDVIIGGTTLSSQALSSTTKQLNDTAASIRITVEDLKKDAGTSNRAELLSGLPQIADGLEEISASLQVADALRKMQTALTMGVAGPPWTTEALSNITQGLRDTAPQIRVTLENLKKNTGTPDRTELVSSLPDLAGGMEEVAATLELQASLLKISTYVGLLAQDTLPTTQSLNAAVEDLTATAAALGKTADDLNKTPGTSNRATLIAGLEQAADQIQEQGVTQLSLFATVLQVRDWIVQFGPTAATLSDVVDSVISMLESLRLPYWEIVAPWVRWAAAGLGEVPELTQALGNLINSVMKLALTLFKSQIDSGISQAQDGVAQISTQFSDQLPQIQDGLASMKTRMQSSRQQPADGLATIEKNFAEQRPTAIAGAAAAGSGAQNAAGLVSNDKHTTLFVINLTDDKGKATESIPELRKVALTGSGVGLGPDTFVEGFRVRMIGASNVSKDMQDVATKDLTKADMYAMPIALVILVLVFGTLAAAALPLVLGIMAIILALGIAAIIGLVMPLNFTIENIVFMMGLAVGIDYALFIAYRYREERRKGRDKIDGIGKAGSTASRAILFSGSIVLISLWGIFLVPCNMHKSLSLGAIIVVGVAVAAALTLLPAVLSLLGDRIDWARLPWQKPITEKEQPKKKEDENSGFWYRVTRPAMRAPIISLVVCIGVLVICITPNFHMKMGYSYVDTLPKGTVSRSGYDAMMEAGFPSFLVAPLDIAIVGYDKPAVKAQTDALIQKLDEDGGFITAVPIEVNDKGDVAWKRVLLNQDPFTPEAASKVKQLRNEYIGGSFKQAGGEALVTGFCAFNSDFFHMSAQYMPWVLAFVLGLSFVLLMVAFRSILLPVVCTIFNLLSVYAAYGLIVFVFQDGHSGGIFQKIQGIDAWIPIFLFCGLFGISMDYFVFLQSRIRERYDETEDMADAIMYAIRRTGGLIIGAAIIMTVVFAAFATGQIVIVAEMGFGLCVAVLIDATLVSIVLVPSAMKLLGKWFWWFPSWLNWLPDLRVKPAHKEIKSEGAPAHHDEKPKGLPDTGQQWGWVNLTDN